MLLFIADDVIVAVSNSGLVKVWTIHDANDARLVSIKLFFPSMPLSFVHYIKYNHISV